MKRKEFLKSLGAGAAFALVFPCVNGCSNNEGDDTIGVITPQPTGVDFTIDLTSSEATKLQTNGGFILKDLVVVVKNLQGEFVAATQICSHEGYDQVRFEKSVDGGIFYCDVHGSRFGQDGQPLNQIPGSVAKPIKIYQTSLEGDILRVFE